MREVYTNGSDGRGRSASELAGAMIAGASGAASLTLSHEVVRLLVPNAPRLDALGMLALGRAFRAIGVRPPRGKRLRGAALIGDLVANGLYYASGGLLRRTWMGAHPYVRGTIIGALAGLGAVVLTPALGLPARLRGRTPRAQAITVGLYTLGGLAAAVVASRLEGRRAEPLEAHEPPNPGGADEIAP